MFSTRNICSIFLDNYYYVFIQILSKDCEELNRILILTIARAMRITGVITFFLLPNLQPEVHQTTSKNFHLATTTRDVSCITTYMGAMFGLFWSILVN